MKPDYPDITSRLGAPLWYDEHGVPRYEPFHPGLCDVYADYVALLEVECQGCGQVLKVAQSISLMDERVARQDVRWLPELPKAGRIGHFHYGDPPSHLNAVGEHCVGASMNTIPRRVLEFWRRDRGHPWKWVRDHRHEIELSGDPFGFEEATQP